MKTVNDSEINKMMRKLACLSSTIKRNEGKDSTLVICGQEEKMALEYMMIDFCGLSFANLQERTHLFGCKIVFVENMIRMSDWCDIVDVDE